MKCCLNLRLDFGSFWGQFVKKKLFLPKMKKTEPYRMPTLLKDVNLFIITAYMPLIMKWGVSPI